MNLMTIFTMSGLIASSFACRPMSSDQESGLRANGSQNDLVIYLDQIVPGANAERNAGERWIAKLYISPVGQTSVRKLLQEIGPYPSSFFGSPDAVVQLKGEEIQKFRKNEDLAYQITVDWFEEDVIRNDFAGTYSLAIGKSRELSLATVSNLNGPAHILTGKPFEVLVANDDGTDFNMSANWVGANLNVKEVALKRKQLKK